ncbi:50S ribosomal protein L18 [Ulvibacter litoralis]|uniref:Large ribosomal subunit protein uL18 n=1 Tax=Ulvibacter litoralis TaxID=227084 RepID=A0A1G7BZ61_9FLAO|nr:50S ribosomal protein L18 [Ulvibacter litoralis]GHC49410.1 50S ribosomal protein L18 [Ulvibacter litoralis]SDE31706.1 large subunit ribosomal protein L18 [Ulvibacter litoralis]
MALSKTDRRNRLRFRIRKTISGTAQRPRLAVFRSNKEIYAQLIDDVSGKTITAASSRDKDIDASKVNKVEAAKLVGKAIAEKAVKAGVDAISFDRGGYLYHGRIKSLAEGAREGGLKF